MTITRNLTNANWKTEYEHMKKHSRMWERRAKENLELAQRLEDKLAASEAHRVALAARLKYLHEEPSQSPEAFELAEPFIQVGHSTGVSGEMVYKNVPASTLLNR